MYKPHFEIWDVDVMVHFMPCINLRKGQGLAWEPTCLTCKHMACMHSFDYYFDIYIPILMHIKPFYSMEPGLNGNA